MMCSCLVHVELTLVIYYTLFLLAAWHGTHKRWTQTIYTRRRRPHHTLTRHHHNVTRSQHVCSSRSIAFSSQRRHLICLSGSSEHLGFYRRKETRHTAMRALERYGELYSICLRQSNTYTYSYLIIIAVSSSSSRQELSVCVFVLLSRSVLRFGSEHYDVRHGFMQMEKEQKVFRFGTYDDRSVWDENVWIFK